MSYVPISKLPLVDEYTVTGEVAESFDAMRTMLGVPTVAIFGPSDPAVWRPVGPL